MMAAAPPPFSHKPHAELKLECAWCHTTAKTAERAGFPKAGKCMTCHQAVKTDSPAIRELAALPKDARPFTARVYKVADFVFFSHARHAAAKLDCGACHGPVWDGDAARQEPITTMKACVDCHRTHKATVACTACHELSQ
jgi:hypothetical protein